MNKLKELIEDTIFDVTYNVKSLVHKLRKYFHSLWLAILGKSYKPNCCELYSGYYYIQTQLGYILDKMIKEKGGFPCRFKNYEEWGEILIELKTINHRLLEDNYNDFDLTSIDRERFITLLSKHFFNLWI